jgi:hypothetical protein
LPLAKLAQPKETEAQNNFCSFGVFSGPKLVSSDIFVHPDSPIEKHLSS